MGLELNQIVTKADLVPIFQQIAELKKENAYLRRGLSAYVGTAEAMRLTGVSRSTLLNWRREGLIEHKGEGRKVLYLRTDLERINDQATVSSQARRKQRTATI